MAKLNPVEQLARTIFGKSEVQNRIALNAVKMIIGDVVTLYEEFRKTEGLGALFFNPSNPEVSHYMPIKDIQTDVILAEEIMDNDLRDFLNKLINVINREQDSNMPVVVMVSTEGMSIHLIDLDKAKETLEEKADAVSRD